MKCVACDTEITRNQVCGFMFGGRFETYPVCKDCMTKMTAAATRKAQDRAEQPDETELDPEPEYDPGLIEEGL